MKRARFVLAATAIALASLGGPALPAVPASALRVCADPNNLPFSDQDRSGFENELAEMLGRYLHRRVEYTWWAQRRGALRNTLQAKSCDVVLGIPTSLELVAATRAYYASSYVFVSKAERALDVTSFDDPRLKTLRIGVQLIGDDYANTPPVHALSARGISDNVRGFSVLGDYSQPAPAARVLQAVDTGDVDIAIVWGPLAGYFAQREKKHWRLTPTPARDGALPMRFEIGMGVRRGDQELRQRLDTFIARNGASIDALLDRFGVPRT
jgi:quinoprotein dehydrogenase-associated probable ABC transporter substrate-binding protein